MKKITPKEACKQMEAINESPTGALSAMDTEQRHVVADELLCEVLQQLGYTKVVTAFKKMTKWYS